MSRYRKTRLFIRPDAPLWKEDLIIKQVQIEDLRENSTVTPYKPIPFTPESTLKKSVGWWNFFKTAVYQFRP